ncbi:hypothetical protein DM01DRAFT_1300564 [Hesseltinella vesiculosa]|uniref:Uncharacterized protein n=1 Tax=Hesseltinella vesiculosa TaxID=101127 RepID=A0A1X2GTD9_9FUNG|nr:hypothetical protein DM01DRAFT_1300564 [Hesseltinella vesiculosa]
MDLERRWLNQHSPTTCRLLMLPKELIQHIVTQVAKDTSPTNLYPHSLIELSKCNRYLFSLIHRDPWRLYTLWPQAFRQRFDTLAIYRRQLHRWNWQKVIKLRCKALHTCLSFASQPTNEALLGKIQWEIVWDMITEHDERNMAHLLNHQVQVAAVAAFQLDQHRDRRLYPVVLPILSLLVNYDFSITSHFRTPLLTQASSIDTIHGRIVSDELSSFAYNFDAADSLITKHMPLRRFHASSQQVNETLPDDALPLTFYPALDAPAAALHLFFATFFASHPSLYNAIPSCIPIPLFPLQSEMFDVEYLRRYERNLFINSDMDAPHSWAEHVTTLPSINIYADSGFASSTHFVSEAHHIQGEWLGYYSFIDPEDEQANNVTTEDWFDGPMRMSLRIVPLEEGQQVTTAASSSFLISTSTAASVVAASSSTQHTPWPSRWSSSAIPPSGHEHAFDHGRKRQRRNDRSAAVPQPAFPHRHLKQCPLTKFEGTGVDNLGSFTVVGLIDDTEDGQVTWEKTYIESGETWEYSGRFALPMGICGRWGDEDYGGPWWVWKMADDSNPSGASVNSK